MSLAVDHLVICVPTLEFGVRYANGLGLASIPGGRHAGHGTANRIVPLGDNYLELVAVVDEHEAARSVFGSWVAIRARSDASVDAVCLRTSDLDEVCGRLDLIPISMSRVRPDGVELTWRLVGLEQALGDGLPFFIEWGVPDARLPGRARVRHPGGPAYVEDLVLRGDSARLELWTAGTERVHIREGEAGASVTIRTRSGDFSL
jgi:hypothetical protein